MTTDIERELRELFREKAGEAPAATFNAPTAAPQEVLRRGRRRQLGTVLGSAAIVLVLIVGSVAGLNAVLRGEEDPFRTGGTMTSSSALPRSRRSRSRAPPTGTW